MQWSLLAALAAPAAVRAWDNGVALVPPMGWSSWYALSTGLSCDSERNALSERAVLANAAALAEAGLVELGFSRMVLDDCWQAKARDAAGFLHGDAATFPRGIAWLAAALRRRGLQLGLYTTPGEFSCMKRPASLGHEAQDVDLWVRQWGVRYFKYCVCNTTEARRQVAYSQMQDLLNRTGLPVVYEIDPAHDFPMTRMDGVGHVVGAHDDVADSYSSWTAAIADFWAWGVYGGQHTRPGHWPLIDILQLGRGGQTREEYRSQLSMYVMLCSPIILGIDFRNASWAAEALPLLRNPEVWDILRDELGRHGRRVAGAGAAGAETWARPLRDGGFALALWNTRGEEPIDIVADLAAATGQRRAWRVRDVWAQADAGVAEARWTARGVPPHGLRLVRLYQDAAAARIHI